MKTTLKVISAIVLFSLSMNGGLQVYSNLNESAQTNKTTQKLSKAQEWVLKLPEVDKAIGKVADKWIAKGKQEEGIEKFRKVAIVIRKKGIKYVEKKELDWYKVYVTLGQILDDHADRMEKTLEKTNEEKEITIDNSDSQRSITEVKEEVKPIIREAVEKVEDTRKVEPLEQQKEDTKKLKEAGLNDFESALLALKTIEGDGFAFCANFTPDIYTHNGLRTANGRSGDVKGLRELIAEKWRYIYDNKEAYNDFYRIQECISILYYRDLYNTDITIDQQYVKKIMNEYLGKEYKVHTKTFYDNGVLPENIDKFLEQHHSK